MSFNIRPTQGCLYLKVLLFCYGHPCIYESFCCHMLICTITVFDIANSCMSSDGKRLSSLKRKIKKSQSSYLNFGEPAVFRPSGASASSSPHHRLRPPPALAGQCQGITGRLFGENSAWIAIVGCTVLNFFPHPFLLRNFKAMHGKFFRKLVVLGFFPLPRFRYPPSPIISKSK